MKSHLIFCKSFIFLILFLYSFMVYAQKLPDIQKNSAWLPSTVKIDGRFTEWNDVLAAYNKHTQIDYLIANDDKNLYLAVSATDPVTVGKIVAGGISLTINRPGRDKNEPAPVITFPVGNFKEIQSYTKFLDTVSLKSVILQVKEIKVKGVEGISDSLLFISNDYGIKTKIAYRNGQLFYELLMPLEPLGLSGTRPGSFDFNLRLNGKPPVFRLGESRDAPIGISSSVHRIPVAAIPGSPKFLAYELMMPADFSGKYKLSLSGK